jgi:hypothetical protein
MDLIVNDKYSNSGILLPTAESLRIGDRVTGHGIREIPFPSAATLKSKRSIGARTLCLHFSFDEPDRADVVVLVERTRVMYLERSGSSPSHRAPQSPGGPMGATCFLCSQLGILSAS